MSYCSHLLGPVPECTASVAKTLLTGEAGRFRELAIQLRELFQEIGPGLEKAYPEHGQWGVHPLRVIGLLILQAMEGATDRQALEAVKLNVGWKLVLNLKMTDQGWQHSVLSKARERLLETEVLMYLFDAILQKAKDRGYLNVVKQRLDATDIAGCVRLLNKTELILETVRNSIEELSEEAPEFVMSIRKEAWLKRYYLDRPFNYRLPKKDVERTKIAETAGEDGQYILKEIEKLPEAKRRKIEKLNSIKTLRRVLDEQFDSTGRGKPKLKDSKNLKPSGERIASPYETDARNASKGEKNWTGYKVHLTETCVKGFPNLITQVETTVATESDSLTLPAIAQSLVKRNLCPKKLLTDGGYVNVETITELKKENGINVVARLTNGHSWQSQAGKGFDQTGFQIDFSKKEAICPRKQKECRMETYKGWRKQCPF